uniref:carbohydrate ABC transporter permease n=1 Tax=Thaumasiovibrio occultus TaxID=1891184 RepID=UPI000B3575FD|nr:sugar ABC transporter permease [Thaumasiovibrio occultus]
MGGTQFRRGEYIKGALFLAVQVLFLLNAMDLLSALKGLITLGEVAQQRRGFDIIQGDNSVFMLVEGVIAAILVMVFALFYWINLNDAKYPTVAEGTLGVQLKKFYEKHFHFIALTPAAFAAIFFVFLPIIITVLVAMTNYSAPNHIPPRNLVDWVGFGNFIALFKMNIWSGTFFGVAVWTVTWAILVTIATFSFGFLLALAVENKEIKFKKFWRVTFILPYAIPAFVSLLVFRLLLNGVGPVNTLLGNIGIDSIPFLTDPTLAKITVILVSVWVSAPYFMLLISGALTNIPEDLYEASEVDGASKFQQFFEITLPMVLHQVAPSLVMTFAHNFNNFGAIFLLTEGGPINADYRYAGHTDILITWIYKLTLDFQQYHIASVVSILIFMFLSVIAVWQFRRMKSFKDDVGM